jgi:16S rRNA (uracil1498-N3)-methyltransferase
VDPRPKKLERFRKAAIESAKQCGRAYLMAIDETADFSEVIGRKDVTKLIGDPAGEAIRAPSDEDVLIVIGPEGGFTDNERAQALQAGCRPWAFAPHILRIETAAAAAAAIARSPSGRG